MDKIKKSAVCACVLAILFHIICAYATYSVIQANVGYEANPFSLYWYFGIPGIFIVSIPIIIAGSGVLFHIAKNEDIWWLPWILTSILAGDAGNDIIQLIIADVHSLAMWATLPLISAGVLEIVVFAFAKRRGTQLPQTASFCGASEGASCTFPSFQVS